MTDQLAFYFDASACANCKACQIACQDKNDLPYHLRWRRVVSYGGGGWVPHHTDKGVMVPDVFAYSISTACNHCENPLCADVCPSGAINKLSNGTVQIDADKCIGCRYCEWACPYGAPQFNEEIGVMTKCNFCVDLQAVGDNPACVDASVMRALDYGPLDELKAKYGDQMVEPLPPADITNPGLVVTPHKHSQAVGSGTGKLMNLPEEV